MLRRIARHLFFVSVLSQFIVGCPGQYLESGFGGPIAAGMAGAPTIGMRPGSGGYIFETDSGGYTFGQGLGYRNEMVVPISTPPRAYSGCGYRPELDDGSRMGPSYGYGNGIAPSYGCGSGIALSNGCSSGIPSEIGLATGITYNNYGGMGHRLGYGSGFNSVGSTYPNIGSGFSLEPGFGHDENWRMANTDALGAGMNGGDGRWSSYATGVPPFAPVYLSPVAGLGIPSARQQALVSAHENTNTNVNINNSMGKHRAGHLSRGFLRNHKT